MVKVIVSGAKGRMGTCIVNAVAAAEDLKLVGCFDPHCAGQVVSCADGDFACSDDLGALIDATGADVVVDFTQPGAVLANVECVLSHGAHAVVGTTGVARQDMEALALKYADKGGKLFFAPNFTTGAVLMMQFAKVAGKFFPDVEIVEMHHNQKLDVPSGTALTLANSIASVRPDAEFVIGRHENGKREKNQIGIHSLRLGNLAGTHEILIATGSEVLTLRHEARDRALFADGAMQAARFLVGKPAGLYTMQEIIHREDAQ